MAPKKKRRDHWGFDLEPEIVVPSNRVDQLLMKAMLLGKDPKSANVRCAGWLGDENFLDISQFEAPKNGGGWFRWFSFSIGWLLGSSSSRSFLGVNNDLHDKDLAFQHRHFNGISVFLIAKKDGSNYDLRLDWPRGDKNCQGGDLLIEKKEMSFPRSHERYTATWKPWHALHKDQWFVSNFSKSWLPQHIVCTSFEQKNTQPRSTASWWRCASKTPRKTQSWKPYHTPHLGTKKNH